MGDNIYKLKVDNSNNILYGSGLTKFAIEVPPYLQEKLSNKQLALWVETAQLKAEIGSADLGTDYLAIKSSISQPNYYSNTTDGNSSILCYFNAERKGITAATSLICLDYPTEKMVIRDLSNVIEFEIVESFTETQVTLQAADLWLAVICIEVLGENNI